MQISESNQKKLTRVAKLYNTDETEILNLMISTFEEDPLDVEFFDPYMPSIIHAGLEKTMCDTE